jgi:ATP-dependent DNA ligase
MVKPLQSRYIPKDRKHWFKIKGDYIGAVESMDVIVLGAYFREGKLWAGIPSRFLVAIKSDDPTAWDSEEGVRYFAFAKVSSGLENSEVMELAEKLKDKFYEPPREDYMPPWLRGWHPEKEDKPSRFIRPEDSVILEVRSYSP